MGRVAIAIGTAAAVLTVSTPALAELPFARGGADLNDPKDLYLDAGEVLGDLNVVG